LAPGTGDPANFDLNDWNTQRNLDERGRQQARDIGKAFRDRGIPVARVLTSQWRRCTETAELMDVGPVVEEPAFNSFFRNREKEPEATANARSILAAAPQDKVTIVVTHQVNITALTGRFIQSGEITVVRVNDQGDVTILGSIDGISGW